jgi:hypothetical protein
MRGWIAAGVVLLAARTAQAAEDELLLAFEPGYALLTAPTDLHGAGGRLTASYGITDSIWLSASGGADRHLSRGESEGRTLWEAFAGITVALDILRTVPFLEGLIGVVGADLGDRTKIDPSVRLGAGFDFLVTRSFSLGAVFRYRPVSDDLGDSLLTIDARLTWRIEL